MSDKHAMCSQEVQTSSDCSDCQIFSWLFIYAPFTSLEIHVHKWLTIQQIIPDEMYYIVTVIW